jgi:hypothetical protein
VGDGETGDSMSKLLGLLVHKGNESGIGESKTPRKSTVVLDQKTFSNQVHREIQTRIPQETKAKDLREQCRHHPVHHCNIGNHLQSQQQVVDDNGCRHRVSSRFANKTPHQDQAKSTLADSTGVIQSMWLLWWTLACAITSRLLPATKSAFSRAFA